MVSFPREGSDRPSGSVAGALHELAAVLLTSDQLDDALQRTAEITAPTVPDGVGCGVTLVRDAGRPTTVGFSNRRVRVIDESEYATGQGPCLHTLRTQEPVDVRDTLADTRWPSFAETALACGVRSSHSEPLSVDAQTIGVLNCYSSRPDAFSPADRRNARLVADHIEVLLGSHLRHLDQIQLSEQMQQALDTRATIDQAIGILMAQRHCDAEEAFGILRQASNRSNVKLRDVAARLARSVARKPADS
jgi:GAF domain-containing protein